MFTPKQIKNFNEIEMDMYHFVINNKSLIPFMTIREFATKVHSSPSSVLRFCKKVGCEGFVEFKVCFKQILENDQYKMSYSDDKTGLFQDFLAKIKTPKFIEKLDKAVKLIMQGERLYCLGAGPTGSIAFYAATHISAAGFFATYIDEYFMLTAPHFSSDTYMLFCVSGEDKEMIIFADKIKASGGKTLLITNSYISTLAKKCDVVIGYNLYYAKSLQKTVTTLSGHENMDYVVDSYSTQLPTVYLIETIAKSLGKKNII
ncbi:MAG: MurR/RpiR family transcriptional regulator [Eubacteriaceae bacterium]